MQARRNHELHLTARGGVGFPQWFTGLSSSELIRQTVDIEIGSHCRMAAGDRRRGPILDSSFVVAGNRNAAFPGALLPILRPPAWPLASAWPSIFRIEVALVILTGAVEIAQIPGATHA